MRLPRIKYAQTPGRRRADGVIRVGSGIYGVAMELQDEPDGSVWTLMNLLDGTRDVETVVAHMCREDPSLDAESIRAGVATLIELGVVEDAGAPTPPSLSVAEIARYASNTRYFSWVDLAPRPSPYEQQRLLKQARVSVLGLGGTGGAAAMSLLAAGVGSLLCADFDVVEPGNLTRQLLYTEHDVGMSKVDAAVQRLRGTNRHVAVTGHPVRVGSVEDLLPLMDADLFLLCADDPLPDLQVWTNDAALRTGTPWIISRYNGPLTLISLFVPHLTPCYSCLAHQFPAMGPGPVDDQGWQALYQVARGHAVIAPVAVIGGQLAALEAIRHLTGMPTQTAGRLFRQNLVIYDHSLAADLEFWPDCPDCGEQRIEAGSAGASRGSGRG